MTTNGAPNDSQPTAPEGSGTSGGLFGIPARWLIIGGSVVGGVLAVAAVVAVLFVTGVFGGGARHPEYTARFYPEDTMIYAGVTLNPGGGQRGNMMDLWERFNEYRAFEDVVDNLKKDFNNETGFDFDDDIMPWLGPELSVAILDDNPRTGITFMAAVIGVRDYDEASDFVAQLLEHREETEFLDFDQDDYLDYDVWIGEDGAESYALTDKWLVIATGEGEIESILDLIAGEEDDSLAESNNFIAAQAALPETRFASIYIGDLPAGDSFVDTPITASDLDWFDWAAVSAGWLERGIVLETVLPSDGDLGLEMGSVENPAELLPADIAGFAALSFDPSVERWRDALKGYRLGDIASTPYMIDELNYNLTGIAPLGIYLSQDDTFEDVLDVGLELADNYFGIDLESDLFELLDGQAVIAVKEFDLQEAEADAVANPINAVAMLSYRNDGEEDLQDTMDDVADLIEEYTFLAVVRDEEDVGADSDATVFRITETEYEPGYVLHDGYLTLGTTEQALESVIEWQRGEGEALADDPEYQRAVGNLPGSRQFLAYIDLHWFINQMGAEYLDMEPRDHRILSESLGSWALSGNVGNDYHSITTVLTLFPE